MVTTRNKRRPSTMAAEEPPKIPRVVEGTRRRGRPRTRTIQAPPSPVASPVVSAVPARPSVPRSSRRIAIESSSDDESLTDFVDSTVNIEDPESAAEVERFSDHEDTLSEMSILSDSLEDDDSCDILVADLDLPTEPQPLALSPVREKVDWAALTDEQMQTLRSVVAKEVQLELGLKYKELQLIEDELAYGEYLVEDLQRRMANGKRLVKLTVPPTPQTSDTEIPQSNTEVPCESLSVSSPMRRSAVQAMQNFNEDTPSDKNTPNGSRQRSSGSCVYGRRGDGAFIRLVCRFCGRQDFLNRVGFINHCRNSHQHHLMSVEDYHRECGVVVDEAEVPADDPCRSDCAVDHLKQLDHLLQKTHEEDNRIETEIKTFGNEADFVKLHDLDEETGLFDHESDPSDEQSEEEGTSSLESAQKSIAPLRASYDELSGLPVSPIGLPTIHAPLGSGSRFYMKRRILVGNVSKFIPMSKRLNDRRLAYKWMVYVIPGSEDTGPLENFVEYVRFYLHPSYRPNDVMEIRRPPFQLVRYGWGEFPVRVHIQFRDAHLNKPVDIIHSLQLDPTRCEKQVQGPQRAFEIELDRYTQFADGSGELPTETPKNVEATLEEALPPAKPSLSLQHVTENETSSAIAECRFCGLVHATRCNFRPASFKGKRKSTLTSLSSFSRLLSQVQVPPPELVAVDEKEKKVQENGPFDLSIVQELISSYEGSLPSRTITLSQALCTIKSMLKPLQLPNLFSLINNYTVRTSNSEVTPEGQSRAILYLALRAFLRHLLKKSLFIYNAEEKATANAVELARGSSRPSVETPETPIDVEMQEVDTPRPKRLTPYHVYRGIFTDRQMGLDFLTNDYIEEPTTSVNAQHESMDLDDSGAIEITN